jgi:small subunit ribosomal protein S6
MNKFEAVLILSPEISTTIRSDICEDFTKQVKNYTGEIINTEDWGLRDLSYKIGNNSKAFYNYFQIEIDGNNIENIKKNLTQNENCIRHLFVKVKDHQELPTKLINEKK